MPQGCTKVYFEAVGGGGAGGFLFSQGEGEIVEADMHNYYKVSGGGGGGAYGRSDTLKTGLNPGETFTITVGKGGRNYASRLKHSDYVSDCNIDHPSWLADWAWETACSVPSAWNNHDKYRRFWHGPWPVNEGTVLNPNWVTYEWPFYNLDSRVSTDGGNSSVKRNAGSGTMLLEAYGGKSVGGINNTSGGAGGAAAGAGAFHARGGNGGNAVDNCGLIGYDEGAISSGGGGAAGHPGDYATQSPDYRTEAYCDKEEGFGRGGTGYPPFYGYGGEGTSDWAWDADAHNGSVGDPGQNYGGGGGGSKQGLIGFTNGANGADGIVRVWFYMDAPDLTVVPTATPSTFNAGGGQTTLSPGANNLSQTASEGGNIFQTTYSWLPSVPANLKPTVTETTEYCVTVTNICNYATNSDACRVWNRGCVTVTVNPINAGAIEADDANWVCTPGDTVVTITSTTAGSPAGGDYSWQYSSNGSSWTPIPDANGSEYTVVNTTGYYRRGYAIGSNGPVYTAAVSVTRPSDINPGMVKDNSGNTTTNVCSGGNVSVKLSAGNTTYPVTWQTSTNGTDWTNYTGSVNPYVKNGLTTKTYIRYVVNYTTSCGVPSNNYYTLNVWTNPEVNSITGPSSTCPNQTSYELTADVTAGSSDNLTYHWDGATGSGNTGTITPTTPNCKIPYSYSLSVTDGNGCTSNTVTGNFTTDNPTWNLGTISNVTAASDGSCNFSIPALPTLTEVVNNALNSSCGNAATLSNPNPAVGYPISETTDVTAKATDMCGVQHDVTITVVKPETPTVQVLPTAASKQYLCPGETTTITVITSAEEPVTYQWYPNSLGNEKNATTIAYTGEDVEVHSDYYYVVVTDKYGCPSNGGINIYTTPKPYILNKTYEICTPEEATLTPTADDKVPAGNTTLGSSTFTYTTTYSWIITDNTGVTGATEAADQANFTTGTLTNSTLTTQTVTYSVVPTTATSVDGYDATSCDGDAFTVTVEVKPTITTTGAITNFDNADVIITLWYGACDTLYNVITPTYTNNTDLDVTLTNDKGGTVNAGPLLGRIAPGEYTIEWKLTDECGNEVTYTKKYIVRYPNCGEDDPNYTEPYRVTYDGYTYTTVRIGCECWLKENLRNQVDADGNNIAVAKVYQNDNSHLNPFGRLYTWYSAMGVTEDDNTAVPTTAQGRLGIYTPGICPEGWAIPKDAQFEDMMTYAHNNTREASSKNQAYWLPGAAGIDPNNGFEAVGAGYYDHYADFYYNLLAETHFWTSTPSSTTYKGKCVTFTHICPEMIKEEMMKGNAISVRCVKIEPKPILD